VTTTTVIACWLKRRIASAAPGNTSTSRGSEIAVLLRKNGAQVDDHATLRHAGDDRRVAKSKARLDRIGTAGDRERDGRNARRRERAAADTRLALDDLDCRAVQLSAKALGAIA
jgi:hypothetical protein